LSGVLGQVLGESPADQKARIEEAAKNARDLTGLVRHKKKPKVEDGEAETATNGKRKLEEAEVGNGEAKKAKI